MAEVKEENQASGSSATAKTALGLSIGALGGLLVNGGLGNVLGGILGGNGVNGGTASMAAAAASAVDKYADMRSEILQLKSEKYTDQGLKPLELQLVRQDEMLKAIRTEMGQALQLEAVQRANGDQNLRQYVDDNFVHAEKMVAASRITPAVSVWPFNTPSFAQAAYPVPFAPFPPFGPFPPPPAPATGTSSSTGGTEATNG